MYQSLEPADYVLKMAIAFEAQVNFLKALDCKSIPSALRSEMAELIVRISERINLILEKESLTYNNGYMLPVEAALLMEWDDKISRLKRARDYYVMEKYNQRFFVHE